MIKLRSDQTCLWTINNYNKNFTEPRSALSFGAFPGLRGVNRDFAFFVFERTKHQPRRNLRSYLDLQRLCNEAALSPGIDAFWF